MRLKVKDSNEYPGYKVCGVDRGKKADEHAFYAFLVNKMKLPLKSLPRRIDKKQGAWLDGKHMFPPVRGYAKLLVPELEKYPCDVCEFARYNSQCRLQAACMPYLYYMLASTEKMVGPAVPKKNLNVAFKVPNDRKKGKGKGKEKGKGNSGAARQRKSAGSRNDPSVPRKRSAKKGKAGKEKGRSHK
jgi:hypothetical protein